MRSKLILLGVMLTLLVGMSMTSCTRVKVDATDEAVLVHKPMFFGSGGVDTKPISTGSEWVWATTDAVMFSIVPTKYTETLDDIISNENTPLDFKTQITIQINEGKSPILLKNYGENWYENNIKEQYINYTRHYVSQYSPFDLTSNREITARIDSCVLSDMISYVSTLSKDKEMPITIRSVITGRAIPNAQQLNEMNNTAAQVQAKVTEERRAEKEMARENAERQRAIADKAYMREMNLTTEEFIALRQWEIIEGKEGANIDVLVGGGTQSMWNVRR